MVLSGGYDEAGQGTVQGELILKRALVLGIGNDRQQDAGFGCHVVRALIGRVPENEVELLDGGAMGLELLPNLEHRPGVIVVDAVDFGGTPGDLLRVKAADLASFVGAQLTDHQHSLGEVLAEMERLDMQPHEFYYFGCQPQNVDAGGQLSPRVLAAVDPMANKVLEQLRVWVGQ